MHAAPGSSRPPGPSLSNTQSEPSIRQLNFNYSVNRLIHFGSMQLLCGCRCFWAICCNKRQLKWCFWYSAHGKISRSIAGSCMRVVLEEPFLCFIYPKGFKVSNCFSFIQFAKFCRVYDVPLWQVIKNRDTYQSQMFLCSQKYVSLGISWKTTRVWLQALEQILILNGSLHESGIHWGTAERYGKVAYKEGSALAILYQMLKSHDFPDTISSDNCDAAHGSGLNHNLLYHTLITQLEYWILTVESQHSKVKYFPIFRRQILSCLSYRKAD